MSWLRRAIVVLVAHSLACEAPDGAQRLTASADPSAPLVNLTQWNWNRQIAVGADGSVHVVWAQLATLNIDLPADRPDPVDPATLPAGQIFYLRSDDGGATFSQAMELGAREVGTDSASVAVSDGCVYVMFRALDGGRQRAFVRRSNDNGASWSERAGVSDNPADAGVSAPAFAVDGASLYAVWADARPQSVAGSSVRVREVYLASSPDGGVTWSSAQPISTPDGFSSWTPAIAVAAPAIHVAWTDERDDVGECTRDGNPCREEEYYRRSLDSGASWELETRLTFDPAESWAPTMAASEGSVHVAYLDRRTGHFQVYYQRSTDGGRSFSEEVQIASDARFANAARPTIAALDRTVHLAWFGFTDFEADVYVARSDDGGTSWSPFVDLTERAPGAARVPHVAVGPDQDAHVVWYDTRASDASGPRIELFYARP